MLSSLQSLSRVPLFATAWTAAHQASLSITNSWSLPKFMSLSFYTDWHTFPGGASGKEPVFQCRRHKRCGYNPWDGKTPGVGNGNPLQYSCLENSMDRGVWWTAFHRVTNNGIWLKQHSRHLGKPSNCPSFVQAFVFKNSQCKDYAGDTAGINMNLIFPIFSLGNKQE